MEYERGGLCIDRIRLLLGGDRGGGVMGLRGEVFEGGR